MLTKQAAGKLTALFTPLSLGARNHSPAVESSSDGSESTSTSAATSEPKINLQNRVMMGPLYLNLEHREQPKAEEQMSIAGGFYAQRALNDVGLVVYGGLAPSKLGRFAFHARSLTTTTSAKELEAVTDAVHTAGGKIIAQAFHCGRFCLRKVYTSCTSTPSPIRPYWEARPLPIPRFMMNYVVSEFERFASLAEMAGFDGIEISLAEGSLLHNFISSAVNDRTDDFGGSIENRLEIVRRVLANIKNRLLKPESFFVSAQLCVHDLHPNGNPIDEILYTAETVAASTNVDLITTSVGMHDSPIQKNASYVPKAAFAPAVKQVREHLRKKGYDVPIAAGHRINTPELAEELLQDEVCDLVSLTRPLFADPAFVAKAKAAQGETIIPCIACGHCTNMLFKRQPVLCALNPQSGTEPERSRGLVPTRFPRSIAVVGAGPAGITCALTLARRGHEVVLFEKASCIGGQLNLAKVIPGKEEYFMLLEHWTHQLRQSNVRVRLNTEFDDKDIRRGTQGFNSVVLAVGSIPRPFFSGILQGTTENPNVVMFTDVLKGRVKCGRRVAIMGKGAIAFDVASYVLHDHKVCRSRDAYLKEWGVDLKAGTMEANPEVRVNNREVTLIQDTQMTPDLAWGKGFSQKLWLQKHSGVYLRNMDVEGIRGKQLDLRTFDARRTEFTMQVDTLVWANGMLENLSIMTYMHDYIVEGARQKGLLDHDFGIYLAGSCRNAAHTDGRGEQDLHQAISEGFEIGQKIF